MKYVLLILVLTTVFLTACDTKEEETDLDAFAKCLTGKNIKLFGTESCPYCKMQRDAFEDSLQYIDYTDCSKDPQPCQENNIGGVPDWIIDNKHNPGFKTIEQLKELVDC